MLTVAAALQSLRHTLIPLSETGSLDAQVLLAEATGQSRAWVLAHPEAPLTPAQQQWLQHAVRRLQAGEPLPYVLGHWEFFGLDFLLTPDVLIPRPETELLVERALARLSASNAPALVADAGTGSGCIAVALAVHRPGLHLIATDRSHAALRLARRNAIRHGVHDRIRWLQTDLLSGVRGPFDLICANLPYIPSADLPGLAVSHHEPNLALDGGADGLRLIARLLPQARERLRPGGTLLLEIEYRQGAAVRHLAQAHFPHAEVHLHPDVQGHPRVVEIIPHED